MTNIKFELSPALRFIIAGAGLFVITFGMMNSSNILNPFFLALIVAISIAPLIGWLRRKGMPPWLALLTTLLLLILFLAALIVLLTVSVDELINTVPTYEDSADQIKESIQSFLSDLGLSGSTLKSAVSVFDPSKLLGFFTALLADVGKTLGNAVFMLLILIFMLFDAGGFPTKLRTGLAPDNPLLARLMKFKDDIRHYVVITTKINFLVGLVDAVFLMIIGVDFAILWGLLAWLLGYIPSIGFWLALIPPTLIALLELGWQQALIVFLGYVLINGSVQNFLQPKLMGGGLNLSPLVVTISLFFWAWVLGPLGALIAIPLTLAVKEIVLEGSDDTRWLSTVMGSGEKGQTPTAVSAAEAAGAEKNAEEENQHQSDNSEKEA
jgi:AI-2 transport protein TqsA